MGAGYTVQNRIANDRADIFPQTPPEPDCEQLPLSALHVMLLPNQQKQGNQHFIGIGIAVTMPNSEDLC
jgi:hypothetical protein